MRISDWSSDVCSSDLAALVEGRAGEEIAIAPFGDFQHIALKIAAVVEAEIIGGDGQIFERTHLRRRLNAEALALLREDFGVDRLRRPMTRRSEEHTSELQSLMRISYAVFCLKKNKTTTDTRIVTIEIHKI